MTIALTETPITLTTAVGGAAVADTGQVRIVTRGTRDALINEIFDGLNRNRD